MGSGAILNEVIKAREILEDKYKVAADVYSVTSYKELYYDALQTDRHNMLNLDEPKKNYLEETLAGAGKVFVAASDYVKAVPLSVGKWLDGRYIVLGTDGYGRSDGREQLRDFFEIDARYIVLAALYGLMQEKAVTAETVKKAVKDLKIDINKLNPLIS